MRKSKFEPEPRLLTQQQAAAYCGLCVSNFRKACRVKPVQMLGRIPRYDRRDLDRWLDSLSPYRDATEELDLGALWDAGNSCTREGH